VDIFALPGLLLMVISLVTFVAQAFAFVDAFTHRAEAYVAADKMTKQAWCIILGLAVVAHMLFWDPISLFNIAGIIATLVYLLDVRPALRELTQRR
jgi:uncharacterized YccA/Bax inhibitor family protein